MINASPRKHPQHDADKVIRIATSDGVAQLVGPYRHLRRVRKHLPESSDVDVTLGKDSRTREWNLVVSPADVAAWSAPRDRL